jgi:FlaA1/EpsC-like NDP-sugar epimerase
VALVDDDPRLAGTVIAGVRVRRPAELPALVARHRVRRVLLAVPGIDRRRRRAIIEDLARLAVHVQTLPDIVDLVAGRARVDELAEVDVVDLLGREPVPPDPALLDRCIRGKSVMVTGAGGSIGSALCQQILRLGPRRLVLFEISEHALYRVEQDLRRAAAHADPGVEVVALLGSVHHLDRVHSIMTAFGVQTVYHAAAYKHVPIVEANMVEGIHNNVIGTWHCAEAAEAAGVETFVLVSTDKAVNPTNVMGATKRVAELVLQGMAERGSRTRFCMVRFGNVLDSSGSVVPLFRAQIRAGGPVTVTHPDVVRYFMTIPEAASLVIQAGSMASGGDVFLLDMGEPVRIADLARRMINLSGYTVCDAGNPQGAIPIVYTGLRPGEKLYEELLIGGDCAATGHPRILRAVEEGLPWARVRYLLGEFLAAANTFDCERALGLLRETVGGYRPVTTQVEDLVWRESGGQSRLPDRTSLATPLRPVSTRAT